ncbi:MAG: nucleotide exchange factor GrpE [Verrucomicrobia bacterium TMED56]|nr:MAG: nucleotide exchange factor GrpE [Verrucomicrobia bacterium TMED56]
MNKDQNTERVDNNETESDEPENVHEDTPEKSSEVDPNQTDEKLRKKVSSAYSKDENFKDKYIRVMADIENLRKRQIQEREDAVIRTRSQIIGDLLPVLDAFQIGMVEAEKDEATKNLFIGFSMACKQMENILGEYGLEIINPKGETFDPQIHEALSYQTSDQIKEGDILKAVRVGYKIRDKLLRPASVIISQGDVKENA